MAYRKRNACGCCAACTRQAKGGRAPAMKYWIFIAAVTVITVTLMALTGGHP